MTVPLDYYIILSAFLFVVGVIGVVASRNLIVMFISIEIMLSAANLSMMAFSRYLQNMDGHVFVFLVMAVAAAEAAVGLAIIIAVFKNKETVNADALNLMKW
ncbi:MAG: NADH-quinone oxidoreductase subunit NuoK [candidate division Zixibacteria bacterium]|nr:NADH-quinone oxidoreductase subunit NuoK [candidate division Zixibacteria bacterium]